MDDSVFPFLTVAWLPGTGIRPRSRSGPQRGIACRGMALRTASTQRARKRDIPPLRPAVARDTAGCSERSPRLRVDEGSRDSLRVRTVLDQSGEVGDDEVLVRRTRSHRCHRPRLERRSGWGISSTLRPIMASPRPRETFATASGSSTSVAALTTAPAHRAGCRTWRGPGRRTRPPPRTASSPGVPGPRDAASVEQHLQCGSCLVPSDCRLERIGDAGGQS